MISTRLAVAAVVSVLAGSTASAQTDQLGMAHEAAANQLGVLEYCQSQGYTDEKAVIAQRGLIARLPASTVSTEAAEATGKQGTMSVNGNAMTLASMANSHNTTESAMCKQMAGNVIQSAAMQQQNGMAMGVPGMPRMPSMPSMPAPGSMPAMPSMPPTPHF